MTDRTEPPCNACDRGVPLMDDGTHPMVSGGESVAVECPRAAVREELERLRDKLCDMCNDGLEMFGAEHDVGHGWEVCQAWAVVERLAELEDA